LPFLVALLTFTLAAGDAFAERRSRRGDSAERDSGSERQQRKSSESRQESTAQKRSSSKKSSKKSKKKSSRRRSSKKKSAPSGPVAVPIDVGIGPQLFVPNPPLFFEQPLYTALNISIAAVIDKQLIERNKDRIPKEYRDAAGNVGEVRIRPWWLALIPSTLVVSPDVIPGVTTTGMYGA